jgi:prepilin-type N-terminal cleavage/methylation domain-containing protein
LSAAIDRLSEIANWRFVALYIAPMKTQIRKQQQAGFTLYELMITLLIVGVVLSYGLVNLSDFNRNGRITASANDLLGAFHVARSESARAKANITICASANPMAALPQCGGTWDQGYIVFQDDDATDLQVDANEAILRRHGPVEDGVNLNFEGGATHFSYSPTGLGRTLAGVPSVSRVVMCDERGNVSGGSGYSTARLFVVTPLGRAAILREIDQLTTAFGALSPTCT